MPRAAYSRARFTSTTAAISSCVGSEFRSTAVLSMPGMRARRRIFRALAACTICSCVIQNLPECICFSASYCGVVRYPFVSQWSFRLARNIMVFMVFRREASADSMT